MNEVGVNSGPQSSQRVNAEPGLQEGWHNLLLKRTYCFVRATDLLLFCLVAHRQTSSIVYSSPSPIGKPV